MAVPPSPDARPAVLLAGAEPWSHVGVPSDEGRLPAGVLVLHGLTGTPQSVRGLAEAFAAAGFAVEMPLLPGHGTHPDDLLDMRWEHWVAATEDAYRRLVVRSREVVVAGLSMGGALAVWLACHHPELAGMVCINPAVEPAPDELIESVRALVATGTLTTDAIGGDIADPEAREVAYDVLPLEPLLSLFEGVRDLAPRLGDVTCPALIMTSPEDHIVAPTASELLALAVAGPVERVVLARSYHVATLDHDRHELEVHAVGFARKVTAS